MRQVAAEVRAPEDEPGRTGAGPTQVLTVRLEMNPRRVLLVGLLLAQAAWLSVLVMRGWYSGPDLGNLAKATGEPLDLSYLTSSVGGHFGAPARLVYWVLNRAAPLNWGLTVAVRVLLQALGTLLLWRLLDALVGRLAWTPVIVGLYAFSPLLVPGISVLSSAQGLVAGQATLLGMLLSHVRYERGGGLRWGLLTALLAFLTVSICDQAAVALALLPLLSFTFLHRPAEESRVAHLRRTWPGWAALAVALLGFAALYLSGSFGGGSRHFDLGLARYAAWQEWTDVLGPAAAGGPWHYVTRQYNWEAFGGRSLPSVLLGQAVLLGLVVASVRRTGRRALVAWAIPVIITLGDALLIAMGRADFLHGHVAPVLRYSYFTPLGLALGAALAFARTPEESLADPAVRPRGRRTGSGTWPGWRRALLAVAAVVVLVGSLTSALRYSERFAKNPSRAYVDALVASARSAPAELEVYDSTVPQDVIPALEPQHFVSDVLGLAGVKVSYADATPFPLVADGSGRLVRSLFYPVTEAQGDGTKDCGTYLRGAGSRRLYFAQIQPPKDWFLQLQLYQPHANEVRLKVLDSQGRELRFARGSQSFQSSDSLVAVTRRLVVGSPASLVLSTDDPATNLCLVHAYIGAPFPRSGS